MSQSATYVQLNRLLAIVGRSFPQYLQYSRPHVPPGRSNLVDALDGIAADQNVMVERISQMLADGDLPARFGEFPMEYTDLHDLDLDYLVTQAVRYQEQDIATIADIVEQLRLAPAAQSLAEEALGMAKGQLDTLRELLPEAANN